MKLNRHSRMAIVAAAGALTLTLAACGSDNAVPASTTPGATTGNESTSTLSGQLAGAGASSQESAMQAWIAGFQNANPDVSVAYDPIGSGGGRTQFLDGGVQFAGSDAALKDDELTKAATRCASGAAAELPVYISPIAVIFNLEGIDSLNMSAATIAGIFNQKITKWNAPEIAAENPDVTLPDLAITPVNRSDESGTTQNFTDYLAAVAPEAWPYEASGVWPVAGSQSAEGTSGLVQTVTDGSGTIGYADASKAGNLGTATLKVGDAYVPFSAEGAATVVDASPRAEGRPASSIVVNLDRTTTVEGAYPLVLVSYEIACTGYENPDDAALVKGFLSYIVSAEGQSAAVNAAGSAPISDSLRSEVQAVIDSIA